jgi:hypothetical protein
MVVYKGKVVPVQAKAPSEEVEVQLCVLLTSTLDGGEWSAMSQPPYLQGNSLQYPLDRVGGTQSQSAHCGHSLALPGIGSFNV